MGLIDQTLDPAATKPLVPNDQVAQSKSFGYDPTFGTVNNGTDTVSGQLDKILSQDSPYVTRARASANEASNSRGLINSTMGAQAGEAAAIDSALPIAQQDAGTYSQQRLANQGVSNTADQFGASAANQSGIVNAGAQNTAAGQTREIASQTALQNLRGDQATALANIEANYKSLIQTSSSASSFYTAQTNNIAAVMADPNTTPEQKQLAVDKLSQILQSGLTVIGAIGNVNIAGLLDFSGTNQAITSTSPETTAQFTQPLNFTQPANGGDE